MNKACRKQKSCMFYMSDKVIFHSWTPTIIFSTVAMPLVKVLHWYSLGEINSDLTLKQTQILYKVISIRSGLSNYFIIANTKCLS